MVTAIGYVLTGDGTVLLQLPDTSTFGFLLADDDQAWPGGFGVAEGGFDLLDDDDTRISGEDRERLGWLLERERANSFTLRDTEGRAVARHYFAEGPDEHLIDCLLCEDAAFAGESLEAQRDNLAEHLEDVHGRSLA